MAHIPRILIVEDSPVQALALRQVLEQEGAIVLCAPNGRDGVRMAQACAPDAIVLDIEMPEMDGFEACRRLKADPRTADIPVVILTIHGDRAAMVMRGLDLGAMDFIPKDNFANAVLLETLRQLHILDGGLEGKRPPPSGSSQEVPDDPNAQGRLDR